MKMNDIQTCYKKQIEELVEVCRRAGQLGFGASSGGNVSSRVDDNLVLVSPTHTIKREMCFNDVCAVDMEGNIVFTPEGKKPSGETSMHLHIYKMRPDVKAIMHAHPPFLIGMSFIDMDIMSLPLLPESMTQLGPVIKVPYAEPNSDFLGTSFDPYIKDSNAFVMENHGALACSTNGVRETVEFIELMEHMVQSLITAKIMGGEIRTMNDDEMAGLDRLLTSRGEHLPGVNGRYASMKEAFVKR